MSSMQKRSTKKNTSRRASRGKKKPAGKDQIMTLYQSVLAFLVAKDKSAGCGHISIPRGSEISEMLSANKHPGETIAEMLERWLKRSVTEGGDGYHLATTAFKDLVPFMPDDNKARLLYQRICSKIRNGCHTRFAFVSQKRISRSRNGAGPVLITILASSAIEEMSELEFITNILDISPKHGRRSRR